MTDHFSMKRENSEMDEISIHNVKIKSEIRDPDLDSDVFKEEISYPENKINISEPDNDNGKEIRKTFCFVCTLGIISLPL